MINVITGVRETKGAPTQRPAVLTSSAPPLAPVGSAGAKNTRIDTCSTVKALSGISRPEKDLVVWRRSIPSSISNWLEKIEPSQLPDFRILVRPSDVRRAIEPQLNTNGMSSTNEQNLFIDDISNLVSVFADITHSQFVDVRLDRISHDACWKFHRDSVETRLLTTYVGPSTEWVDPAYAEQALQEQRDYEGPLERLGVNDVAVFSGSLSKSGDGIVHRSPPIEGTKITRLLLCLNTQSITSPEPWRAKTDLPTC